MRLDEWRGLMIRQLRDENTFNKFKGDKEFLLWLCGFIDGEGNFSIFKRQKRGILPIFTLVNTDLDTMKYIHDKIGIGSLYFKNYSADKKRKTLGRLQITRQKELLSLLPLILPHLKVKKLQAERMYNLLTKWHGTIDKNEREVILHDFKADDGK